VQEGSSDPFGHLANNPVHDFIESERSKLEELLNRWKRLDEELTRDSQEQFSEAGPAAPESSAQASAASPSNDTRPEDSHEASSDHTCANSNGLPAQHSVQMGCAACSRRETQAWVSTSGYSKHDVTPNTAFFFTDSSHHLKAWVFPDGLEVGRQVHYFCERESEEGYPRYGRLRKRESKTLSIGEVTSIEGNAIDFRWAGAVSQEDGGAWAAGSMPSEQLAMEDGQGHDSGWDGRRGHYSTSHLARRRDNYRISVPDAAWSLLPQQTFLVTLIAHESIEDGLIFARLSTLNGDELKLMLEKDSTVKQLMSLIASKRRLGPHTHVDVLSVDGEILEEDMVVKCVA